MSVERAPLAELCDQGLTQRGIADRLAVSHTTVRYWLKRYGLRTSGRLIAKPWDADAFAKACSESLTVAEVLDRIGVSKYSGNYRRAALFADRLGVDLPVARQGEWHARASTPVLDDDQVRARFRRTEVPQDLRLLCPNCHAQTETGNRRK